MNFTDPAFLFAALPLGLMVFYWLARRYGKNAAFGAMFALSLLAYSSWGARNMALLLASITVNFLVGRLLIAVPDQRRRLRRTALCLGQAYNFSTLIWFKYQVVQLLLQRAMGAETPTPMQLALPVGISFYTFQQAAFLMDAFHRDPAVAAHIGGSSTWRARVGAMIRYGAFATFFPQLVIGPIIYLKEFQRQTSSDRFGRLRQQDIVAGLALLGIGLFKKLVIADSLGTITDPIFAIAAQGAGIHAATAWIGILSFYAQLYFDFSGYSDMALGIGRLFGIRFPVNFYSPLKAVGIIDYYRRWHMTLTRVISRFLYTPLSMMGTRWAIANRLPKGLLRLLGLWIPLLINFEVIALWHGAASTFIVFGLIHGTWYVLETECRATNWWKSWRWRTPDWLRTALGRLILFVPMCLTFALFRSESLEAAARLYAQLFSFDFGLARPATDLRESIVLARDGSFVVLKLIGAFAVIHLLPNSMELMRRWRPGIMTYQNKSYGGIFRLQWRPTWAWACFWLFLVATSLYFVSRQTPFIYMEF